MSASTPVTFNYLDDFVAALDKAKVEVPPTYPPKVPRDEIKYTLPKYIFLRNSSGKYLSAFSSSPIPGIVGFSDTASQAAFWEPISQGNDIYQFKVGTGGRFGGGGYLSRSNASGIGQHLTDLAEYFLIGWFGGPPADYRLSFAQNNGVYLCDDLEPAWKYYISGDSYEDTNVAICYQFIQTNSIFTIQEAAVSHTITSVNYAIDSAKIENLQPLVALSTTLTNPSTSATLTQELGYSYTRTKTGTWNNVAGTTLGVEASFTAGVPFISSVEFDVSVEASYSHEWGGSEGEEETITSTTTVTIPPNSSAKAVVLILNARIDVPFTYTEEIMYSNGETSKTVNKQGTYRNVDYYHVDPQVTDVKTLPAST